MRALSLPPKVRQDTLAPYTKRHSGTVLVCGTAWSLAADFLKASALRPNAKVCGVNRTGQFVRCDFMFSYDLPKVAGWKRLQTGVFNRCVEYHAAHPAAERIAPDYPDIDVWWTALPGGGTSSWGAAKAMLMAGFDEIILCGVPLAPGGYVDGVAADNFDSLEHCDNCRQALEGPQSAWLRPYVRSMSGWTRELLGAPDGA